MKKLFISLGAWISSFFTKKTYVKPEVEYESTDEIKESIPEIWENPYVSKTEEELIEEPSITEKPLQLNPTEFSTQKNVVLALSSGKTFDVTEKQLLFYNIIKEFQKEKGSVKGHEIVDKFIRIKYPHLSESELVKKVAQNKLSHHGKTTKGLFKLGILTRIDKNQYKVEI